MRALILIMSLWLASPAAAQTGAGALQDRIALLGQGTRTPAECDAQVAQASELNGPDLLYGAWVCFAAGRDVDGNYLLNVGQISVLFYSIELNVEC